jgi:flagellar basal-body rod protein FlgG
MSRSFFNAFTGVAAYQRSLQQVADNMANVNTNAYKRSEVSFTELLYSELQEKRYAVDPLADKLAPISGKGVHLYPVTRFFDQGQLMLTDRPLDLAIEGSGFFKVTREDGSEGYTRRGSFFIDNNGDVITDQGDYLDADLNINGVAINTVVIGPDGQVTGANDAGERLALGQINIYTFINEGGLEKGSSGLFEPTEASGDPQEGVPGSEGFGSLRQYFLEASNVDLSMEMVQLILNQRALQANVRSLVTADELKALTLLVRN